MDEVRKEIRDAIERATNSLPLVQNEIRNKDIVIFLGNTRSGKSTLVNYIIGTKLLGLKVRRNLYKIRKADEYGYGPHILHGTLSDTTISGVYRSTGQQGTIFVDAPGFGDNRGEAQDIVNALFITQIKHSRSCKFVLVSDICEIVSDNIGSFLIFMTRMLDLVPNIENLQQSVSLVLTKDNNEFTQKEIATKLQNSIRETGLSISEECRNLIRCFVENPNLIGLFRMPSHEGEITDEVNMSIRDAISNSSFLSMNFRRIEIEMPISNEARTVILEMCQEFVDRIEFTQELWKIVHAYQHYFFVPDYVFASLDEELEQTEESLIKLNFNLTSQYHNITYITSLSAIEQSLKSLVTVNLYGEFHQTFTSLVMLDEANLMKQMFKDVIIRKYGCSLQEIIQSIDKVLAEIKAEQKDRKEKDVRFTVCLARAAGATAMGTFLFQGMTAGAVAATSLLGVATGIGTIVAVLGAGASLDAYLAMKQQLKNRTDIRRKQGRPLPNFDSE